MMIVGLFLYFAIYAAVNLWLLYRYLQVFLLRWSKTDSLV